ncbi:aldo/keto reductase [Staphylococcus sp. ACRSN]|uniref:aldo/keto reductase n=1 Tax=Staphylococcus sp. ACRSN TaxID=2918214 RepID=UPI001EF292BF|nr:aldo/keto reductase [Staphylococcus sp. ACRSN]MCG7338843.1 aldo/keto reductase [Staphylococcus sp. ACRSN]
MKMRVLGNSNIQVSAIGLGAMGMDHAYGPQSDRDEMKSLLKRAVDLGCNFFDTAPVYGESNERLLGEAFKGIRENVIIATKFGITGQEKVSNKIQNKLNSKPNSIRQQIDGSLERLETDYIDLYFQHRVDPDVEPEEVAQTMSELIQEGKIKAWGVSEAPLDYIKRAHRICPISAIENQYSMVYRKPEDELFEFCEEQNIAFVAYSPLGNGFLSGKYSDNQSFSDDDFRSEMGRFKPEVMAQNQAVLDEITQMAKDKNVTPAQIVLAWELHQKPFIIPIPGTTKIERLKENLKSNEVELSEQELDYLNQTLDKLDIDETHF